MLKGIGSWLKYGLSVWFTVSSGLLTSERFTHATWNALVFNYSIPSFYQNFLAHKKSTSCWDNWQNSMYLETKRNLFPDCSDSFLDSFYKGTCMMLFMVDDWEHLEIFYLCPYSKTLNCKCVFSTEKGFQMIEILDFSSLALLTFGTGSFSVVGKYPVCNRMFILAASLDATP